MRLNDLCQAGLASINADFLRAIARMAVLTVAYFMSNTGSEPPQRREFALLQALIIKGDIFNNNHIKKIIAGRQERKIDTNFGLIQKLQAHESCSGSISKPERL
jgi:hypothetical protein